MKRILLPLLMTTSLILSACSAVSFSDQTPPQSFDQAQDKPAPVSTESVPSSANDASASGDLTRSDGQGAVTIEVTPLNLDNSSGSLEFDVVLDTHSIDLSMDLAPLSTLTTDAGITVQATIWDAPRGGHHVEGRLIFPAIKDGTSILNGAGKLTLTISNVDAPSRIFEWKLQ